MPISDYKPYRLSIAYGVGITHSDLTKPYGLVLTYDPDASAGVFFIGAGGFSSSKTGSASIYNKEVRVSLNGRGFSSSRFGTPLTYNLKQFVRLSGATHTSYGNAYLQGGVRWIKTIGIAPFAVGQPSLVNTTANQYAKPAGIARTTIVPAPIITPHMIYARGIYSTAFGSLVAVPTPVLRQKGLNHLVAGTPTVWFHTRPVATNGIDSYSSGYAKVFDPAQTFYPSPILRSSVFGDIRIRNNNSYLRAQAIDSQAVSEWATVEARNRNVYAKSFLSQAIGNQLIRNKSPSIFFNGLPAPIFFAPAITYRIQSVKPRGINKPSIGNPIVIKTPEMKPLGLTATLFGRQWVSNHTRYIENNSKDYSLFGNNVVWFGTRYAKTAGFVSMVFGLNNTVTHGVRTVFARGFIQQGYGASWVSRGIRGIETTSIYKELPSSHYVGRHQEIKVEGYTATLFGTRIIPEAISVYPQGFVGVFGQNTVGLYTRYLKAKGYLTAGEQPAFRWGRQIVYNSVQFITQDYDGNNGLVPPKWSDWTAIENRNKDIGAIGFNSQKFGYSYIYNNASPLLVKAIEPVVINKPMISYRLRPILLDSINPIPMSDWGVVYNGAKVIAPKGFIATDFGLADALKTRRYYSSIGRIDSLEAGVPMIAYRVRTVDIETRYSIAPPQIRLPTIDILTKYIAFRGYETAKYGLASLSIHFNIIRTRWSHRNNAGEPIVKNLTPEVGAYGHNSELFGVSAIRTEWRHVYAYGNNASLYGRAVIADTKQFIVINGWRDTSVAQKHTVIKTGAPPYSQQIISLDGWTDYSKAEAEYVPGYGFDSPSSIKTGKRVPNPSLNQNVLYAKGYDAALYGVAFTWSNNLYIESGIAIHSMGDGTVVANRNNVIASAGNIEPTIKLGKPRLSPHTIYAVVEAPKQAIDNHKEENTKVRLHYVGGYNSEYDVGFKVGRPKVESTIRGISLSGIGGFAPGYPALSLKLRPLKPKGFSFKKFGIPKIPFSLQTVEQFGDDKPSEKWGLVKITAIDNGSKTISCTGIHPLVINKPVIDLLHRTVKPAGYSALKMGAKKDGDKPYMWQGLRVGAHVPTAITGGDMFISGSARISLFIREVGADGFYSFVSEYNPLQFKDRMTVALVRPPLDDTRRIITIGSVSSSIGNADTKLGQHYIKPDGNSDQFRKGGYHA